MGQRLQPVQPLIMVRKSKSLSTKRMPPTMERVVTDRTGTDDLLGRFLDSTVREHYADQDLVIATLNIAGLTVHKLTILLRYMVAFHVDILCLQDVRLTIEQAKFFKKRILSELGPGSLVKASILSPHTDTEELRYSNRIGGQLIASSPRWGKRCVSSWSDDSGLGLAMGLELLTPAQHRIQIINTYWPISSTNTLLDTWWARTTSWLARTRRTGSPLAYIQHLLKCKLHNFLAKPNHSNVLVGDLNASRVGNGGTHSGLEDWLGDTLLTSSIDREEESSTYTRWSGPSHPTGHIDHVCYSPDRAITPTSTHTLDSSLWFGLTDHRPKQTAFTVNGGSPDRTVVVPDVLYPVDLNIKNKAQVEDFQRELSLRWQNLPQLSGNATQTELASHLRLMSETLYASTKAVMPTSKPTRNFKDGWSPEYIAIKAQLTALTEIRRHLQGANHRQKWHTTFIPIGIKREIDKWVSTISRYKPEEKERFLSFIPDRGPAYWRTVSTANVPTLIQHCSLDMSRLLTRIHGRQRAELRTNISAAVALRERHLQEGRLGKVIKSVLGTEQSRFEYAALHTNNSILTDPIEIHNKVAEHFQEWFSSPKDVQSGIHSNTEDWRTIFSDKVKFFAHARSRAVPDELTAIIWEAVRQPMEDPRARELSDRLAEELRAPPTFEEFHSSIKYASAGSAAGLTGASYNMLKSSPEHVLRDIYGVLAKLWDNKTIPDWWQWRILAVLPKVAGSQSLDHLRPLMLAECLRKVWTVIPLRKIQRAWEDTGMLAEEQHGFRPGRSTESAIMQILNLVSSAHESGCPLFSTFWDITRAFDSVSKNVLKASWLRLGVPADIADWLVSMDMGGGAIPRSPQASHAFRATTCAQTQFAHISTHPDQMAYFTTERGCGQGVPDSPSNWTSFFDIPLRALKLADSTPSFLHATTGISQAGTDSAYADDLATVSRTQVGLQRKMDVVSAFASIFHF